jgi:hypothetical protein
MLELLQQMPVSPPYLHERWDSGKVPCVCGKYMPVAECEVEFSGYVNYCVALCEEHRKDLREYARIVCPRCKMLVLLVKPQKNKHGFEFKKGGVYHVERCRFCAPEVNCAAVVEMKVFYNARNIPYPPGDLLS